MGEGINTDNVYLNIVPLIKWVEISVILQNVIFSKIITILI